MRRITLSAQQPGMTCLEICAGAGGQSLGLEQAGFAHLAAVELTDGREACGKRHENMCVTVLELGHPGL